MSPRGLFLIFCVSFLSGDVLGCLWDIQSLLFVLAFLLFFFLIQRKSRILIGMVILGVLLGMSIGLKEQKKKQEEYISLIRMIQSAEKKPVWSGVVEKILYRKERTSVYRLNIDTFDSSSTSIFIEVPSNLSLQKGEKIRFSAKIEKNLEFPLKGYEKYAFWAGGYGHTYVSSFQKEGGGRLSLFERSRRFVEDIFTAYFPRNIAGTLLGMTVGSTENLTEEVKNAFTQSGVSHILVVSGSNIAFVILFLSFFLRSLPLKKEAEMGIIGVFIFLYGSLVGWDTSVIRATLMGMLSYIITQYGARSSSKALLGLSAVILTMVDPFAPVYDPGFGLSFSATLGILLFHKKIEHFSKKHDIPHTITSLFSLTLGATLGSFPLLVYHFGSFSLLSLIANILIGVFLGWILFSSVIFLGIASLSKFLGYLFGFLVYMPTRLVLFLTTFFGLWKPLEFPESMRTPICVFILGVYCVLYVDTHDESS